MAAATMAVENSASGGGPGGERRGGRGGGGGAPPAAAAAPPPGPAPVGAGGQGQGGGHPDGGYGDAVPVLGSIGGPGRVGHATRLGKGSVGGRCPILAHISGETLTWTDVAAGTSSRPPA